MQLYHLIFTIGIKIMKRTKNINIANNQNNKMNDENVDNGNIIKIFILKS